MADSWSGSLGWWSSSLGSDRGNLSRLWGVRWRDPLVVRRLCGGRLWRLYGDEVGERWHELAEKCSLDLRRIRRRGRGRPAEPPGREFLELMGVDWRSGSFDSFWEELAGVLKYGGPAALHEDSKMYADMRESARAVHDDADIFVVVEDHGLFTWRVVGSY